MDRIALDIVALSHSVSVTHNYAVVLGEQQGARRLPVVIGAFEAQAIAVAMERMGPARPLTHDLFKNTLDTFDITLREVVISDLMDGIFYARLVCESGGEIVEIDSRTSDAIAMAVRAGCPIYTYDFIMEQAGVILEQESDEEGDPQTATVSTSQGAEIGGMTIEQLESLLEQVIQEENYERAAEIRDEIQRRKS